MSCHKFFLQEYINSKSVCSLAMGALDMAAAKAYANRRSFMVMNEVSIFNIFQTHIIFFPGQRIYFDKINLRVLFERSEFFGRVGNIFPNSNHKHMHTTHKHTPAAHMWPKTFLQTHIKFYLKYHPHHIATIVFSIFGVCARWCWFFFYTFK